MVIREQKRLLNEQTHQRILQKEALKNHTPYTPPEDVDLNATITVPTFMDQGFTRPKVLLLLPYRHYARVFVDTLLTLLPKKMNVYGKSKFMEEFNDEEEEEAQGLPAAVEEDFSRQQRRWVLPAGMRRRLLPRGSGGEGQHLPTVHGLL